MTYLYKGYDRQGAPLRGRVEAPDEQAAARDLLARGVYVASLRPLAAAARPLAAAARAALYRELGALLASGMPLDRALALLRDPAADAGGASSSAAAAALERVAAAVREGRGLADALDGAGAGLAPYERAAVASAEASATLPDALERLAGDLEADEAARASVRSALAYPCFVALLGLAVAGAMLGFVVPAAMRSLEASGLAIPASSRWLVGACRLVVFGLVPAAAALGLAFAAARRRARRDPAAALRLDRLLLRLPGSRFAVERAAERFATILGALVEGGMPVPEALPVAAAGTGRPALADALAGATARIRAGEAPAEALGRVPRIGPLLAQWIRVGEAGGCLPRMLRAAAGRLRARWRRRLALRLALLGPILLALVGAFVLALALGLVLPLLDVARGIGA